MKQQCLQLPIKTNKQYYWHMNQFAEISVDLPKQPVKPPTFLLRKLHKASPSFLFKPLSKRPDDSARMLIQRYKTELYELQSAKCQNEFMEFASGENRQLGEQGMDKKKSLSFISSERERDVSPQIRDYSVNFKKRRLPKLVPVRLMKELPVGQTQEKGSIFAYGKDKIELITFYPRKEAPSQPQ